MSWTANTPEPFVAPLLGGRRRSWLPSWPPATGDSGGDISSIAWWAPDGLSDGNEIRILRASGMGTKPNGVAPYFLFEPGRDGWQASPLSRTSPSVVDGANVALVSSPTLPAEGEALEWTVQGDSNLSGNFLSSGSGVLLPAVPAIGGWVYQSATYRQNFDAPDAWSEDNDYNIKMLRSRTDGQSPEPNAFMGWGQDATDGNPRATGEYMSGGDQSLFEDTGGWPMDADEWKVFELSVHNSTSESAFDGSWFAAINGQRIGPPANGVNTYDFAGEPVCHAFDYRMESSIVGASWRVYMAQWYVDDSGHRVVLSDQATWDDATESTAALQIPTFWSDNDVRVSCRQGRHSSLSSKYLYVLVDDEPVSTSGAAT